MCRMAAERLDYFDFAWKKATLELFDVKVMVHRGETKGTTACISPAGYLQLIFRQESRFMIRRLNAEVENA